MTRVVVNDASCLIDLRKGGLLGALCTLPYTVIVPLPIRESELLNFTEADCLKMISRAFARQGAHRQHRLPERYLR